MAALSKEKKPVSEKIGAFLFFAFSGPRQGALLFRKEDAPERRGVGGSIRGLRGGELFRRAVAVGHGDGVDAVPPRAGDVVAGVADHDGRAVRSALPEQGERPGDDLFLVVRAGLIVQFIFDAAALDDAETAGQAEMSHERFHMGLGLAGRDGEGETRGGAVPHEVSHAGIELAFIEPFRFIALAKPRDDPLDIGRAEAVSGAELHIEGRSDEAGEAGEIGLVDVDAAEPVLERPGDARRGAGERPVQVKEDGSIAGHDGPFCGKMCIQYTRKPAASGKGGKEFLEFPFCARSVPKV